MTLLSHYTTEDGLLGIARSKNFWATNFLDLNDTSEYFYAWSAIQKSALAAAFQRIPAARRQHSFDPEAYASHINNKMREVVSAMGGAGALYIASFARPENDDQSQRGILTLWDRYTRYNGYCLQFDRRELNGWIQTEASFFNYGMLKIVDVKYGIDSSSSEFRSLSEQFETRMLIQLVKNGLGAEFGPSQKEISDMWPDGVFLMGIMDYCAKHKDPCFEDEREVRIFAYPSGNAAPRPFTGIARRKDIHETPVGKKYIVLGEHIYPGIQPRRIIVGPRASLSMDAISSLFPTTPQILNCNLPIAVA